MSGVCTVTRTSYSGLQLLCKRQIGYLSSYVNHMHLWLSLLLVLTERSGPPDRQEMPGRTSGDRQDVHLPSDGQQPLNVLCAQSWKPRVGNLGTDETFPTLLKRNVPSVSGFLCSSVPQVSRPHSDVNLGLVKMAPTPPRTNNRESNITGCLPTPLNRKLRD